MAKQNTQTAEELVFQYKTRYRALYMGALSIVLMLFAIIFYENTFSVMGTLVTYEGQKINDSFLIAIFLVALSLLFSFIGMIYSMINKRLISFLLSATVIIGLSFMITKTGNFNPQEVISKVKIEQTLSK